MHFSFLGWVKSRTQLDPKGPKAQRFHKLIFERMVIDLDPFYSVCKPGYLREMAELCPNFTVGSDKFYRSMLDPTFEKVENKLKARMMADDPPTYSIGLDLWSQYHHGYCGINCHYLTKDWERVIVNLACKPLTEKHTSEHIYNTLKTVLDHWDIFDKTGLSLRDNAANMKGAFKPPLSCLESVGCLAHSLQLVITNDTFRQQGVINVIEKCASLVAHANASDKFYMVFYEQQKKVMNITNKLSLKKGNDTRWNSEFYCLESFEYLKPAIIQTLMSPDLNVDVDFTRQEWEKLARLSKYLDRLRKLPRSFSSEMPAFQW